ncbi:hypothetical protein BJV82DRAFT_715752 [Fennellomyces sp. T-0311]|nr:hypothetical protein BJV82DRAFT_715752 [Fennellomyces sp. T-0311]
MMPPVQKECPPYYMSSVMKRFGHHLSTDQTLYLTGRMAASLHSAPEGSTCSLPRSVNTTDDMQQPPVTNHNVHSQVKTAYKSFFSTFFIMASSSAAPILASAVAAALQSGYRPSLTSSQQPQMMMTPYYPGPAPYHYEGYNYYAPPLPPPPPYQTATCCGIPDICCIAFLLGACFGWCCADELGPPPQF